MPDSESLLERLVRHGVEFVVPFGSCRILGIDALIRAKQAMNRPQDRAALIQLRAIRERTGKRGLGNEGDERLR